MYNIVYHVFHDRSRTLEDLLILPSFSAVTRKPSCLKVRVHVSPFAILNLQGNKEKESIKEQPLKHEKIHMTQATSAPIG